MSDSTVIKREKFWKLMIALIVIIGIGILCAIWLLVETDFTWPSKHFQTMSIPSPDGRYIARVRNSDLSADPSDCTIDVEDSSGKSLPGRPFHLDTGPAIDTVEWNDGSVLGRGLSDLVWIGHVEHGRQVWPSRESSSDNELSNAAEMVGTQSMYLTGGVTDRGLLDLGKCPTLKFVQFYDTSITAEGIRQFKQLAPACLIWDMSQPSPPPGWWPSTRPTTQPATQPH